MPVVSDSLSKSPPIPAPAPAASTILACPRCSYGLRHDGSARRQCPRPDCGYAWDASAGMVAVESPDSRQPFPELHLLPGSPAEATPVRALQKGRLTAGRLPEHVDWPLHSRSISRQGRLAIDWDGSACHVKHDFERTAVMVNGRPLEHGGAVLLELGDRVTVGAVDMEYRLRFAAMPRYGNHADNPDVISGGWVLPAVWKGIEAVRLELGEQPAGIGRSQESDLRLPHATISRSHAFLAPEGGRWRVNDNGSRTGTFVNGNPVISQVIENGDRIQFGPYLFVYEHGCLRRETHLERVAIEAAGLTRDVRTGPWNARKNKRLLDRLDFRIEANEFAGLLGPSGSGKSTLMDALLGRRSATAGEVRYNGQPLERHFDDWRDRIGYVPQEDIINRELTARSALFWAARLRLPPDTANNEIDRAVNEALHAVRLSEHAHTRIGQLSGGQRKRVSIAVELLFGPRVLFLDEPTSGLDPGTEGEIMRLFRQLADQGRTVVCTTHMLENISLFDKVVLLAKEGKLAYCGTPEGMYRHFGVDTPSALYDLLNDAVTVPPDEWRRRFAASPDSDACRPGRIAETAPAPTAPRIFRRTPKFLEQLFRALLGRFAETLLADRRGLLLMFLQPAVIGLIVWMVGSNSGQAAFMTSIAAIWVGCSGAATQIVKEWPLYERERLFNLRIPDYVLSKLIVLSVVGVFQCAILLAWAGAQDDWTGAGFTQWLILWLTLMAGIAMGLAVSAVAGNADKASFIVPMLLMPQLVFGGMQVAPCNMSDLTWGVSRASLALWSHQGLAAALIRDQPVDMDTLKRYATSYAMVHTETDFSPETALADISRPYGEALDAVRAEPNRADRFLNEALIMLFACLAGKLALALLLLKRRDIR